MFAWNRFLSIMLPWLFSFSEVISFTNIGPFLHVFRLVEYLAVVYKAFLISVTDQIFRSVSGWIGVLFTGWVWILCSLWPELRGLVAENEKKKMTIYLPLRKALPVNGSTVPGGGAGGGVDGGYDGETTNVLCVPRPSLQCRYRHTYVHTAILLHKADGGYKMTCSEGHSI